jgi:hypothetical protein
MVVVAVVKEVRKIEMAQWRLAEMLLLLEVCWREGGVAMVQLQAASPSQVPRRRGATR